MPDYDDILQDHLSMLERGEPIDDVLRDLDGEIKILEPLIRLAIAVREVPHPEPIADTVQMQRSKIRDAILASAEKKTIPFHAAPKTRPAPRKQNYWAWLGGATLFAAAGAAVVMILMLASAFGMWQSVRSRQTARVETIVGQAQIATDKAGTDWKNLEEGDRISAGQRLRTLGASYARLSFFEGTITYVYPNADVSFVSISSGKNELQVELQQNSGETWHKVVPFQGETSFFLVRTPSGTASVHGTSFNVKVGQHGMSQFAVNTGEVWVENENEEVVLLPGQTTFAAPNGQLAQPSYQFGVQGSLLSIDPETGAWDVSGVVFSTNPETTINGEPQLGELVIVSGRILEDGSRVADEIQKTDSNEQNAFFTGVLESMDSQGWVIGGANVEVVEDTEKPGNLEVGMPVKVMVNILEDGTWLALKIETLVENPNGPEPIPSATADPDAVPTYKFEPENLNQYTCGSSDAALTGSLLNTADDAKDYAAQVKLGYSIDSGGEYVQSVTLSPDSWERIDAGQKVDFTIHVALTDAWKNAVDESKVKLRIRIDSATNRPDYLNGQLMVSLTAGCEPEDTQTPAAAPTTDDSGTPTVTPTESPVTAIKAAEDEGSCTGANPHPTGMKLAQRHSVSYEEIMDWFCNHRLGFGEIDLGYSLSWSSDLTPEEIFAMRESGLGWGVIKKQVQDSAEASGESGKKDKDKDKGKDKKDK